MNCKWRRTTSKNNHYLGATSNCSAVVLQFFCTLFLASSPPRGTIQSNKQPFEPSMTDSEERRVPTTLNLTVLRRARSPVFCTEHVPRKNVISNSRSRSCQMYTKVILTFVYEGLLESWATIMRKMDASSCNEKPPGFRFLCHRSSYCRHNNTFRRIFPVVLRPLG
jgi:hypothetical protein